MKTYFKYALCIVRDNRLLVLKESDNELYLLPGGRAEAGETSEQALCRELKEELAVDLITATLRHLGAFEDIAAGVEDARVHIDLYSGDFRGTLTPCSEVETLIWFARNDDWTKLAPITRNKILPALIEQGLIS